VRNDGNRDVDFTELPALDLTFADGMSLRAEPFVRRNSGSGGGKGTWSLARTGDGTLVAFGGAEVEYIAVSNEASEALHLIAVDVRLQSGRSLELPMPR
jgi:hypothetical protein